jgi:2-polyprenyl-3-methyl-5-hydroxy-6-metoxy-1,4-benzoquinol methylase
MNLKKHDFINVRCPVCNANNYKVKYESKWPHSITQKELVNIYSSSSDHKLLDRLVICKNCGLGYLNPRLKKEVVIQSYSDGHDFDFISQNNYRVNTFETFLKKFKKQFYGNYKAKVLDVGTAGGAFLEAVKRQNLEGYGIEPSKWLSEYAKSKGLRVMTGTLEENLYRNFLFDTITFWDVIEHLTDPDQALKIANNLLKSNGLLVISYPDYGSIPAKIMGEKWPFLLSVHLVYFNKRNIDLLLERNGFSVIKKEMHFQSLSLGYILKRAANYFPLFNRLEKVIYALKLTNIQVIYWIGQSRLIARKK